ncbi:N-acetyl-gamma-glutamyl-phosphate reductase [Acididesulfobacillus acetoxydans]|uniref:N-acetyl-gamma-glutamyl-phosphate reductase n=1 Tax=Acididesulfobacillus acetoxydans TaxID=1561005 RepID=A0A8S0Y235_9FIRM|nr:N-acetyl-gamma-glutamyl-phosphate reductase [Acididesulfobacillus acetoxydans]CAA7600275.1 N-acetyl-gamma-glutamyl-phosphate reductase [Acididesulfobacillus acetoxydans]CEJ09653.1 N-acetyl-gamma-glutamyl-phosphate reductase [Acididesulfobacillus acetoxydans]
MRVGILGATGYTGQELVRLLSNHAAAEIIYLGSSSMAGKSYAGIFPQFSSEAAVELQDETVPDGVDVLFCALPHGITAARAGNYLARGIKVIDLGADFRLHRPEVYEKWYKVKHPAPELLPEAVYGLPELHRNGINGKSLVANPGCYPTATLLALVPLLRAGLLQEDSLIVDAKSGVSGAGRGASLGTHFSEVNENFKPYGVAEHRHTPEIEQELSEAAGRELVVSFTPHLVPMIRGILVTIYAGIKEGVDEDDLRAAWQESYRDEVFVHVLPEGVWPQTKFASGGNHAFLQLMVDRRTGRAVIAAAIDNLVKGASGQAIQNMNILFGLPEDLGLKGRGMWP